MLFTEYLCRIRVNWHLYSGSASTNSYSEPSYWDAAQALEASTSWCAYKRFKLTLAVSKDPLDDNGRRLAYLFSVGERELQVRVVE